MIKFAFSNIPLRHLEDFHDIVDFYLADTGKILEFGNEHEYTKFYKRMSKEGKEVWLNNGAYGHNRSASMENILKAAEMIGATHLVAPEICNDEFNTLRLILSFKEYIYTNELQYKIIGTCYGTRRYARRLAQVVDIVAFPYERAIPRDYIAYDIEAPVHYFGFRSMRELRHRPPASINTNMPISAVVYGVKLASTQRRPQIPKVEDDWELTPRQIKEIKKVCIELKNVSPKVI